MSNAAFGRHLLAWSVHLLKQKPVLLLSVGVGLIIFAQFLLS
jgi:hypothetical protein